MSVETRYMKLHAPPPTPDDELCHCANPAPFKLMYALTNNPVHCSRCNLEVSPERWAPSPELVEVIATWRNVYQAIYHLWLASGEYEVWARHELTDITSAVNREGLLVREAIAKIWPCYYWLFQDTTADSEPIRHCPRCTKPLAQYPDGIFPQYICQTCHLIAP